MKKTLSLTFAKSSDARRPIITQLMVVDELTSKVETCIDLSEHDFARLLSGSVISVEERRA